MKNIYIKSISLILALIMALAVLMTSCNIGGEHETDSTESSSQSSSESESSQGNQSESTGGSDSSEGSSESQESTSAESDSSDESDKTEDSSEEETGNKTELAVGGEFAPTIIEANKLSGQVNAYFDSSARDNLVVVNGKVNMNLGLAVGNDGYINITNKAGKEFLSNAFVPYIKTSDSKMFYGTNSLGGSDTNIYRLGYYMYDVHVYGGDFFVDGASIINERGIPVSKVSNYKDVAGFKLASGVISYKVADNDGTAGIDSRLYVSGISLDTEKVSFLKISVKSEVCTGGQIFVITDKMADQESFKENVSFEMISDGEWHEYVIKLSDIKNYKGNIKQLRIDIGGLADENIEIKDISMFGVDATVPSARYDRGMYVYPDKINQVLHLISPAESENVLEYGFELKIPASMVEKVIVDDRNGVYDNFNKINWVTTTYVGFDIKDAGVFGLIKINDEAQGRLKVTFDGEYYTLYHYQYAENGKLAEGEDLYLGHRLYFSDTHSFDELQFDAWCEHNPLTEENITVITHGSSPMGRFYSYDGLRGAYKFDVRYGNWNNIFLNAQNMHYNVNAVIKGDEYDRKIYVYTSAVANGQTLECAVIMDKNNVLLPINLEVCKNFAGDGEANEFLADIGYSEVYFPMIIGAGEEYNFTVAHLYQNWGKVPLKQIDSIQFYTPFYHLSCGVTETNCLRPYYDSNKLKNTHTIYCLPDHRAMSAPLWIDSKGSRDPQHTNGGFHNMLEYFSTDGYFTTEFVDDVITSYGPTYAEITMDYITDDGKIKVSYTHIEMPQTDENRGFYICTYEFLDDLTITDAKKNFSFYSVAGRYVDYGKIGYLDENNKSQIVDNTFDGTAYYLLGDECPYFDCFKWVGGNAETENDYVNVSCLVYNYDVQMGGTTFEEGLGLYVEDGWAHLTLNADELNFKKGDKISLNLIITPWGSQQSDYEREDADWNIRNIRENTALDPVAATVIDGEKVESVYVPRVKSLNGTSAEFTLSGGENNVAFEVQGMTNIARPVLYEKNENGEWEVYNYTSSETPDSRGNAHDYDGYMIRYDGDGTFSYSFVVDMTGDVERTFKVVVE